MRLGRSRLLVVSKSLFLELYKKKKKTKNKLNRYRSISSKGFYLTTRLKSDLHKTYSEMRFTMECFNRLGH